MSVRQPGTERLLVASSRLDQRHRWRSESLYGEATAWHGLARAVRCGLQKRRIQAFLTAAAINLKRLAAARLGALIVPVYAIVDVCLAIPMKLVAIASKKRPPPYR